MDQTASNTHTEATDGANPAGQPSAAIAAARQTEASPAASPAQDDGSGRTGLSPIALILFVGLGAVVGIGAVVALLAFGDDDAAPPVTDQAGDASEPADADASPGTDATVPIVPSTTADGVSEPASGTGADPEAGNESAILTATTATAEADGDDPTGVDGDEEAIPCRFNLLAPTLDSAAVECDGGTIAITGDAARWHNDIRSVFLSQGSTGTIYFEPRADGTFDGQPVVELTTGNNQLNSADAAFGVSLLIVEFTGDGQHIDLNGGGRGELTATFQEG